MGKRRQRCDSLFRGNRGFVAVPKPVYHRDQKTIRERPNQVAVALSGLALHVTHSHSPLDALADFFRNSHKNNLCLYRTVGSSSLVSLCPFLHTDGGSFADQRRFQIHPSGASFRQAQAQTFSRGEAVLQGPGDVRDAGPHIVSN